jgi:hypothetical protein
MNDNIEVINVTNFIYPAAMMKSASSLVWLVLSSIQESSNRPDPSKLDDAMTNSFCQ